MSRCRRQLALIAPSAISCGPTNQVPRAMTAPTWIA
jgi:hypothetical protein